MGVLIMMTSRSGSSLVASIFAAHGFRHGTAFSHQFGYKTYESYEVKDWLQAVKPRINYLNGRFCEYFPGLREAVPDGISLIKAGVEYWPLFKPLQWHTVTVRRNPDNIVRSVMAKNPGDLDYVRNLTERRLEMLDQVRKEANGAEIDSDQIMAGDFSGVRAAFDHFGIPFNEKLAASCVDPSKWHYRS